MNQSPRALQSWHSPSDEEGGNGVRSAIPDGSLMVYIFITFSKKRLLLKSDVCGLCKYLI